MKYCSTLTSRRSASLLVALFTGMALWAAPLPTGDDCQLRTQTQGGWGAPPNGNNPGAYLHANFAGAFPGGVTIGCENTLVFTSAQAITNFLPSGGPPSVLPSGTWVNPTGYGNVLAGQLLAATISVGMDAYDPGFGASSTLLGNAIVASGPFAGWTVNAVLAAANDFIGGCGGSYTAPQFNSVLTAINENFTGGNTNNGFLICSESEECEAYAGTLAGFKPTDCLQEGGTAIGGIPIGDAVVPPGYQIAWVLTQGPGLVIIEVRDIPIFDVYAEAFYTIHTLVYNPATLDLTSIVLGVTTGFDIAALLIENGGDICASLDVTGTSVLVENPDAGSLTGFKDEDCLEEGGTVIGATPNGDMHVPPGYQVLYVLTQGPGLVIVDVSPAPFFTVNDLGLYTIHTLVYDPATLNLGGVVIGVTTGFEVNSLLIQGGGVICAALDVAGAPIDIIDCPDEECEADAGTLDSDMGEYGCLEEGGSVVISATPNGDAFVPAGYETLYVLTQGPGLVIVDVSADPSFSVSAAGSYTIHTLVYDPNTLDLSIVELGVTTGFDVNSLLIQGGGEICASLDVAGAAFEVADCPPQCLALAGTLTADEGEIGCLEEGGSVVISATPNGDAFVPAGYETLYVLTQGPGLVIVDVSADPSFSVSAAGSYTIHTLVYDPNTLDLSIVELGVTTGFDVNSLLIQGGGEICASLDVAGAAFEVADCPPQCLALAGTLTADEGEIGCLEEGGSVVISATPNGDAFVPAGYETLYVLTQGPGLVIVDVSADPSFSVSAAGSYTIHTLVYDPNTLDLSIVELGVTTGFDVNSLLIQGGGEICASLDVAGATFEVEDCPPQCLAYAGTLTVTASNVCLQNGLASVTAVPNGDAFVPPGFTTLYVLTLGQDQVILNAGLVPSFVVNAPGQYTVHTIVFELASYDPGTIQLGVTTAGNINALLIQGGGTICASLDMIGATVTVTDCGPGCVASAGNIIADAAQVCLDGGQASLSATPVGNANVPAGYTTLYVLTQGAGLTIIDVEPTPSFAVADVGSYTIHTLVYDPNTLDLSGVVFGVTTGFEVNSLLIQGGGSICASLDVAGAAIEVLSCDEECAANAGTLTIADDEVFLSGGSASFFAFPNGDMLVPPGYQVLYVLTEGPGLVIVATSLTPVFTVNAAGSYTIHTLVYDPTTLDLSIVEPGVTTGFEVNALLIQGGGEICASLDVTGASVSVVNCADGCTAFAGTLTAVESEVCLAEGGAVLAATPNGDAIKPACFERIFVLTAGEELVIINASVTASFVVDSPGLYTIHTLVFDPNTIDLSIIQFGVTTGFEVNALLIQGGGTICASLDVAGAPILVQDCTPSVPGATCDDAIAINCGGTAEGSTIGVANDTATSGAFTCVTSVGTGGQIWYVFTPAEDALVNVNTCTDTDFDSKLHVYTGACGTLVCVAGNDDACGLQSTVNFTATAGVTYLIRVGGFGGAEGNFTLSLECTPIVPPNAGEVCADPIPLGCGASVQGSTAGILNDNVTSGAATCVTTVGSAGQIWYAFTPDVDALVNMNTCTGTNFDSKLHVYTGECGALVCVTGNDDGCSLQSSVNFQATAGTTYLVRVGGFGASAGSFNLVVECGPTQLTDPGDVLSLNAWPSPTAQFLNVEARSNGQNRMELSVWNMQGAQVMGDQVVSGRDLTVMDVSPLKAGVYILRLQAGDQVLTQRFLKMD
ncbi:MAG: T9SS type A sorting domain-containing protein [Flavobacteriales bacterium]|nr:T9SS type A sorting domain-containing protein [Flavobacteriales bacterium]